MTSSKWEEIRRLAADFQRVQLTDAGVKRLSVENCVELVQMLTSARLLDVWHTVDGKEYVTREHLRSLVSTFDDFHKSLSFLL